MQLKWEYVVGIYDNGNPNVIKYVTSVDYSSRSWLAEVGKPALKMKKTLATDLCAGINLNGGVAVVIQMPHYFNLSNNI